MFQVSLSLSDAQLVVSEALPKERLEGESGIRE